MNPYTVATLNGVSTLFENNANNKIIFKTNIGNNNNENLYVSKINP
jgi:hypothetical protein